MKEVESEFHDDVAIVEEPFDVDETEEPFGKRWRQQIVTLTDEHLLALQEGKYVAVDVQEEYVVFLRMEGRKKLGHGG